MLTWYRASGGPGHGYTAFSVRPDLWPPGVDRWARTSGGFALSHWVAWDDPPDAPSALACRDIRAMVGWAADAVRGGMADPGVGESLVLGGQVDLGAPVPGLPWYERESPGGQ